MKIQVDEDLCESNGVCVRVAPAYFSLDDEDRLHITAVTGPTPAQEQRIQDAVRGCPRGALRIVASASPTTTLEDES